MFFRIDLFLIDRYIFYEIIFFKFLFLQGDLSFDLKVEVDKLDEKNSCFDEKFTE